MKLRAEDLFNGEDLEQIASRGAGIDEILSQIAVFRSGIPHVRLLRPCTINDGITLFGKEDLDTLGQRYSRASLSGRALKFVPASGAASRMVKTLSFFYDSHENNALEHVRKEPDRAFFQNTFYTIPTIGISNRENAHSEPRCSGALGKSRRQKRWKAL